MDLILILILVVYKCHEFFYKLKKSGPKTGFLGPFDGIGVSVLGDFVWDLSAPGLHTSLICINEVYNIFSSSIQHCTKTRSTKDTLTNKFWQTTWESKLLILTQWVCNSGREHVIVLCKNRIPAASTFASALIYSDVYSTHLPCHLPAQQVKLNIFWLKNTK